MRNDITKVAPAATELDMLQDKVLLSLEALGFVVLRLQLVRQWLVFFENHKVGQGGPFGSVMRNARACLREDLRGVRDLQI